MKPIKRKSNAAGNLTAQLDAIRSRTNEKSYGSRDRYYEAAKRFCDFLADEFNLQKFANVQGKHIRAYVEHLKAEGTAPSTLRTDLSGIRFFYERSGGKNRLPDNRALALGQRTTGAYNRAWLPEEIRAAASAAKAMGRTDAGIAVRLCALFGLRIEECAKVRAEHLTDALRYGELAVVGKGGQKRAVPVETKEQEAALRNLCAYAGKKGLQPGDYLISRTDKHGVKREIMSLKNWMTNNRGKFTAPKRTARGGGKPRVKNITWHGLRHYYAQQTARLLKARGVKDVKRQVSERLGHHREEVTRIYLDYETKEE